MKPLSLPKGHKLRATVAIDRLFAPRQKGEEGNFPDDRDGALAYPLRAVWRRNAGRAQGEQVQFLIMVPKKRLRHAVDRVVMRRRIREAYRLSHHRLLSDVYGRCGEPVDVAFVYVSDKLEPYQKVSASMGRLLRKMAKSLHE